MDTPASEKKDYLYYFRRNFIRLTAAIFLPIVLLFVLQIHATSQESAEQMKQIEQQQLLLLEKTLASEFFNNTQIVRNLLIYQNVRPFRLQLHPSRASTLIRYLNNHLTNNNIVDEIYMHFFEDEYFYSTKTSFSARSFLSQFNMEYSEKGLEFIARLEAASDVNDTFYLRDIVSGQSASALKPNNAILYVYPYVVDGTVVGSVIFHINEERLNSWIGNNDAQSTFLFDQSGKLLNLPDFSSVLESGLDEDWISQQIQSTLRGEQLSLTMKGCYVLSGSISGTGLYYIRFIENDSLFSAMARIQMFYMLLLLVLLVVACAAFLFLSWPLRKLKNAFPEQQHLGYMEVDSILSSYDNLKQKNRQYRDESRARTQQDFLTSLLKEPVADAHAISAKAESLGIRLDAPYHFVAIGTMDFCDRETLVSSFSQSPHFLYTISVADASDRINWLIGCSQFLDRKQLQQSTLNGRLSIGSVWSGLKHIHDSYCEARSYWDVIGSPSVYYQQIQFAIDTLYKEQSQQLCQKIEDSQFAEALEIGQKLYHQMRSEKVPQLVQCQIFSRIIFSLEKILRQRVSDSKLDVSSVIFSEDPGELFSFFQEQVMELLEWEKRNCPPAALPLSEESILAYIHENYQQEDFSLGQLSDEFGVSSSYLSLYFKEKFKETPLHYCTRLRMEKACQLLSETDLPLKAVVVAVGYNNASSFIRRFKQFYGMTPGDYKKQYYGSAPLDSE